MFWLLYLYYDIIVLFIPNAVYNYLQILLIDFCFIIEVLFCAGYTAHICLQLFKLQAHHYGWNILET